MDECEALLKARGAVQDAVKKHGSNREQLLKALEEAANEDPEIGRAFEIAGCLDIQANQNQKH